MTRAGFVVHFGREAALGAAQRLIGRLRDSGIATRQLGGETLGADETMPQEGFAEALDLVVSVGGDGTFLRAAHVASQIDVPVLGVKVGRMGFLTEVEPDDAEPLIRRALDGNARVEERMAALAAPEAGTEFDPQWGLNEVIVEKRARHRLIKLAVYVDGTYVTTFSADGVIVATPTGSTAYSFSARGPIVSPSVRSLIVTPVAAHMVFDRSFVLVVRAAHLENRGVVLLQQARDPLVLLLFDEEAVRGAFDDDDDPIGHGASSARRRSAISVFESSISPARTSASASSSVTVTRLAWRSSTEPSSTGGTSAAGSISAWK